ncbi:TfuA-like protein [Amycolatopsis lurida]
MTVHVFAGPSIPGARVRELLPGAEVHPPIGHGAVFGLDLAAGDVLAIVDGLFYLNAAVRHKEILAVAERGVRVVGGASMGALRAAELRGHGMRGAGRVYRMYRDGEIDGDDEVALAHATAEHGYRPMSLALVAVREAVREAVARGRFDAAAGRRLVEGLRCLHFPERTVFLLREIGRDAGIPETELDALVRALDGTEPDVKRRDAELVLREVLEPARFEKPRFVRTHHVTRWEDRFTEFGGVPRREVLGLLQLYWPDFPGFYERVVRARMAEIWHCAEKDLAAEFTRRTGIAEVDAELARRWLPPGEDGDALLRLAVATFREAPGLPPLAAVESALPKELIERAARVRAALPEPEPGQADDVRAWLAARWNTAPDVDSLQRAGFARGFAEWGELDKITRALRGRGDGGSIVRELR